MGDLGRSPRMQYHAQSFLNEGYYIDLIGYPGSEPLNTLTNSSFVKIHYLKPTPIFNNIELPKLLIYIWKSIWQSINLLWILLINIRSSSLMLQNPPAIPSLPVCWLFCRLSSTELIIDWHNYAYSIMALCLNLNNPLVKITKFIEYYFGKKADKNFCVTLAMKNDLNDKWGIIANVLYDRPPKNFKSINLEEKHNLMIKLSKKYHEFGDGNDISIFTEKLSNGEIILKLNRPGFIVSSTSWTEDEDFSILFDALNEYESCCINEKNFNYPNLICVITGKGPLKDFWNKLINEKIKRKEWQHIKVVTPWLDNEDYPKLLASADIGVCLHKSSSGLDLPMKVVDMFGCGLPVCAYNFKCLDELVKHNENGFHFSNKQQLCQQLKNWFLNFPNNQLQIELNKKFKNKLNKFQEVRWHGNWSSVVLPCFNNY